jgi:hypothetical protein
MVVCSAPGGRGKFRVSIGVTKLTCGLSPQDRSKSLFRAEFMDGAMSSDDGSG